MIESNDHDKFGERLEAAFDRVLKIGWLAFFACLLWFIFYCLVRAWEAWR